jgi:hypothetical protein
MIGAQSQCELESALGVFFPFVLTEIMLSYMTRTRHEMLEAWMRDGVVYRGRKKNSLKYERRVLAFGACQQHYQRHRREFILKLCQPDNELEVQDGCAKEQYSFHPIVFLNLLYDGENPMWRTRGLKEALQFELIRDHHFDIQSVTPVNSVVNCKRKLGK